MTRCWRGVLAALLAGAGLGVGAPAAGQDPVADTLAADTVVVDSTAFRIRQRLLLLNRAPGADSARAQAYADSMEAAQGGARPASPRLAGPGAATDLYGRLRGLEGYTVTEYTGRAAEYSADDGVLILHGDSTMVATVGFAQGQLTAQERIRYIEATGDLEAVGEPVYVPVNGDQIEAQGLTWNTTADKGSARQAVTQYSEGAQWNITSDFPELTTNLAFGHNARFTSCEREDPHYHFEASQLKIVRGSILVARNVRLYFGDVPVAWLPFIAQGLGRGRSSGLLTPRFSINDVVRTSGGYRRRVSNLGFYWAMSEYSDASIALDWFDDNYTAITGTAQYNWARKFLRGNLGFRQYWRAEGGTELTLRTNHDWEMSERTRMSAQVAYASSSSFVTQNSFNPTEVTQSIDSQGGLQHRFDWGNLSVSGNRRQFLSDDRVEQTLPQLSLSLSTITLFPAPQNRAGPFNNMTLSGSGTLRRSTTSRAEDDLQPDLANTNGSLRAGVNLGRLSVGGSVQYRENASLGVLLNERGDLLKTDSLDAAAELPEAIALRGAQVFQDPTMRQMLLQNYAEAADIADTRLNWTASVDFQQNLVGSTTLTPSISWDGEMRKADTLALAQDFVAAPTRLSFGATLRSDLYGFFPAFGKWDRIRHKVSPSFSYSYSPEVEPTELQERVFGSSVIHPRNVLSIGLNQTFEARVRAEQPGEEGDSATAGLTGGGPQRTEDGFLIPEQAETELLLGIQTSALAYDFVADSTGRFVDGLTTASLNNTIRSDYLRGLTISMRHDLFDETADAESGTTEKTFAPHLEGMNFSYSFSNRSSLFRWLGFGGGGAGPGPGGGGSPTDPFADPEGDPQTLAPATQESIVPDATPRRGTAGGSGAAVGSWDLNLGYSLIRPRTSFGGGNNASQNLTVNMTLVPTEQWEMAWRTSYDLENGGFNDHIISLKRQLHRWEANFDFLQTASGNWTFRFEVRLMDNQDLKFDYQQRSLDRLDAGSR